MLLSAENNLFFENICKLNSNLTTDIKLKFIGIAIMVSFNVVFKTFIITEEHSNYEMYLLNIFV